jgi:hypothetical protein
VKPSSLPPPPLAARATASISADERKQAWLSGEHTGHYHEAAASARAIVRQDGSRYRLFLDAPQAKFDCDLEFGSDGRPKAASACKVAKYDYAGKLQTDIHWWTHDLIAFACGISGQREVCRGSYALHSAGGSDRDVDAVPPGHRTMRIERLLDQNEQTRVGR